MRSVANRALGPGFIALLLLLWEIGSRTGLLSSTYFSRPSQVFDQLAVWTSTGAIWQPVVMTLRKMLAGWALASLVGTVLAVALWSSPSLRAYMSTTLSFMRPLPASALVPPAILVLGLSEQMIVAVIALGTVWPVLAGALRGLDSVDQRLVDVSSVLRLTPFQQMRYVWLPSALPDTLTGVRVSMAGALILSVVGEMLSSQSGLGLTVLQAARSFRSAELYAGVAMLAMLGVLLGSAVAQTEAYLLRWRGALTRG